MSSTEQGWPLRLDGVLARAALTAPAREAVAFDGQSWTYAQVYDRARRLAGALAGLGVAKGDRIALWTTNRPEFVEIFFGVPQLGAIVSPLDYWWNLEEAQGALGQIQPRVLIVGPAQARMVANSPAAIRDAGIEHVFCLDDPPDGNHLASYRDLIGAAPLGEPVPVTAGDPALILFTSGSTGRSKGAVHTHGGLLSAAMTMSLELGLRDGERTLHFLPLFSSCLEHLLPLTLVRATHVLLAQFDARVVWETVRDAAITHFDAVPTTLRRILEAAPDRIPSSLRLISYASERMPNPLITALIERMPAVELRAVLRNDRAPLPDGPRRIGSAAEDRDGRSPDGGGRAVSRGRGRSAGRTWGNRRDRRQESDAVRRLLGRSRGDSPRHARTGHADRRPWALR